MVVMVTIVINNFKTTDNKFILSTRVFFLMPFKYEFIKIIKKLESPSVNDTLPNVAIFHSMDMSYLTIPIISMLAILAIILLTPTPIFILAPWIILHRRKCGYRKTLQKYILIIDIKNINMNFEIKTYVNSLKPRIRNIFKDYRKIHFLSLIIL